jgi:hypothetical protein
MKKKKLIAEIERLNKILSEQRNEIRTLLSDGKEFDKQMIQFKYKVEDDIDRAIWAGNSDGIVTTI